MNEKMEIAIEDITKREINKIYQNNNEITDSITTYAYVNGGHNKISKEKGVDNMNNITPIELKKDELYFAKTKPNAIIPTKRDEDAGRDIYTCETETIVIEPCSTRMIDTGIAIACNKAYFPKFFDKGGMGSKGIIVGAGVGDSGYRDGYFIPLINTNKDRYLIISTQSKEEIKGCNVFNLITKQFEKIDFNELTLENIRDNTYDFLIDKKNCIIKPIEKAITQFVMIEVPVLKEEEVTWDELKSIKSERGLGKLGSTNK